MTRRVTDRKTFKHIIAAMSESQSNLDRVWTAWDEHQRKAPIMGGILIEVGKDPTPAGLSDAIIRALKKSGAKPTDEDMPDGLKAILASIARAAGSTPAPEGDKSGKDVVNKILSTLEKMAGGELNEARAKLVVSKLVVRALRRLKDSPDKDNWTSGTLFGEDVFDDIQHLATCRNCFKHNVPMLVAEVKEVETLVAHHPEFQPAFEKLKAWTEGLVTRIAAYRQEHGLVDKTVNAATSEEPREPQSRVKFS